MIDQQQPPFSVATTKLESSNRLTAGPTNKKLPSKKPRLFQARSCPSFTPKNVPKSPSRIAVCSGGGSSSSTQSPCTAATSQSSAASVDDAKADDNQSSSGSSKSINEKLQQQQQQQQHRLARSNVSILGSIVSLFDHDDKRKRHQPSERLGDFSDSHSVGGDLKGISKADDDDDDGEVAVVQVVQAEEKEGSQKDTLVHQPSRLGLPPRSRSCRHQGSKSTSVRRHSSFHLVSKPVENDDDNAALEVTIEALEANPATELRNKSLSHQQGEDNSDNDEISNVTEDAGSLLDDDDDSKNEDVGSNNESPCNAVSSDNAASARVHSGQLLHGSHENTSQHRRRHSTTLDTRASYASAARGSDEGGLGNNDLHPPRPHPRHHHRSSSTSLSSLQIPVAPPPPPFPLLVEQQQEWSLLDCAKAAGAIYWSLLCAPDVGHQERIV
jgi:hypothetical protein